MASNIFCPCCGWVIAEEERSFNGLLVNRVATLKANFITAHEMLDRLSNKAENKEQIAGLNNRINELKQELIQLGATEIFIDGEMRPL